MACFHVLHRSQPGQVSQLRAGNMDRQGRGRDRLASPVPLLDFLLDLARVVGVDQDGDQVLFLKTLESRRTHLRHQRADSWLHLLDGARVSGDRPGGFHRQSLGAPRLAHFLPTGRQRPQDQKWIKLGDHRVDRSGRRLDPTFAFSSLRHHAPPVGRGAAGSRAIFDPLLSCRSATEPMHTRPQLGGGAQAFEQSERTIAAFSPT